MKLLIIEDEAPAVKKLVKTIEAIDPGVQVAGVTGSIDTSVAWLNENGAPDLIIMDIELSDGQSFEIFNRTQVSSPVIFITSYDEYALKAFKVNSVDYLLKPVQTDELRAALEKYRNNFDRPKPEQYMDSLLQDIQRKLGSKNYRKRFLVKSGNRLVSVEIEDIAYFYSEGRLNFFKTFDRKKYIVDYTMDELEEMVNPEEFFRIGRAFLISLKSIERIDDYFGNRLMLQLSPATDKDAVVSREKVTDFKWWMGK